MTVHLPPRNKFPILKINSALSHSFQNTVIVLLKKYHFPSNNQFVFPAIPDSKNKPTDWNFLKPILVEAKLKKYFMYFYATQFSFCISIFVAQYSSFSIKQNKTDEFNIFLISMSATKSELESPGGNRKLRPEIQRYVPGKTKISKQEQNQNDENSQKRLLGKLKTQQNRWQKQKFESVLNHMTRVDRASN